MKRVKQDKKPERKDIKQLDEQELKNTTGGGGGGGHYIIPTPGNN